MADTKLTALTEDVAPALTDYAYTVKDPAGTPLSRRTTWTLIKDLFKVSYDALYVAKATYDAKGDLLTATAADTPARLAVGTNGQVLKAASGEATGLQWAGQAEVLIIAIGDETTAITTGTAKVCFNMPFEMDNVTVKGNLTTASSSGISTFDINEGAGAGTSILSTKLTIDANELTSATAATPAVVSDTSLANDARITIDIDVAGTGAAGAKITILGTRA